MSQAEKCVDAIKAVLWPPGRMDEDWSAQTITDIVEVLDAFGYLDDVLALKDRT